VKKITKEEKERGGRRREGKEKEGRRRKRKGKKGVPQL
jgi:hypothetical protein